MKWSDLGEFFWKFFGIDRRSAKRIPVDDAIQVYLHRGEGPSLQYCVEARDLSQLGVRFACDVPLHRGTHVDLEIRLGSTQDSNKRIHVKARVARCYRLPDQRRYRIACRFTQPDPAIRRQIEEYLITLESRPQNPSAGS